MSDAPRRLGILLSGRGSNFLAIHHAIAEGRLPNVEIALVLANVAAASGLEAAIQLGLPTALQVSKGTPREDHDAAMIALLREAKVDWVVLAGYMRVLTPAFISAFPNRIVNIHPSLLPAFPGLHAQRQALDYGAKVAGCTVHLVDEAVDHGTIVLQRAVPVLDTDDEATLSARILAEEHLAYPQALARLTSGRYTIRGRQFRQA